MTGVSERLWELVRISHGGNVNAAAKSIGIQQRTLARFVSGQVLDPRRSIMMQIARHYGVDVDWLYDGTGDGVVDRKALANRFAAMIDAKAESDKAAMFVRLGVSRGR